MAGFSWNLAANIRDSRPQQKKSGIGLPHAVYYVLLRKIAAFLYYVYTGYAAVGYIHTSPLPFYIPPHPPLHPLLPPPLPPPTITTD